MRDLLETLAKRRDARYRMLLSVFDQVATIVGDVFEFEPLGSMDDLTDEGTVHQFGDDYQLIILHTPNTDHEAYEALGWAGYGYPEYPDIRIVIGTYVDRDDVPDYDEDTIDRFDLSAEHDYGENKWKVRSDFHHGVNRQGPPDQKLVDCQTRLDELFKRLNENVETNVEEG